MTTPAPASNNDNKGTSTPAVIAGLVIGIAFVLAFSVFMNASGSLLLKSTPTIPLNTLQEQEAMLERGNIAMGFDQNKIMHHFIATSTGGKIMIVALNSSDSETISQIKNHVVDIQYEFSQGNFTKPFFIHDEQVPGTDVMTKKKDMIRYNIEQLNNGSILILKTDDNELLSAIQQFMQYQGMEHKGH